MFKLIYRILMTSRLISGLQRSITRKTNVYNKNIILNRNDWENSRFLCRIMPQLNIRIKKD